MTILVRFWKGVMRLNSETSETADDRSKNEQLGEKGFVLSIGNMLRVSISDPTGIVALKLLLSFVFLPIFVVVVALLISGGISLGDIGLTAIQKLLQGWALI